MKTKKHNFQAPSFVLGLGGSGFKMASLLKKMILDLINGNDTSPVRYLCLDYDNAGSNMASFLSDYGYTSPLEAKSNVAPEFCKIADDSRVQYDAFIKSPPEWADTRFFVQESAEKLKMLRKIGPCRLDAGAGQRKVLSKIGISYKSNYDKVYSKILDAIKPLQTIAVEDAENQNCMNVFICTSLTGGSGSGLLIDIICLLAKIQQTQNLARKFCIYTFNILPDPFINTLGGGHVRSDLVYSNAFCTISELEYLYLNTDSFIPTFHNSPLGSIDLLPMANFLIGDTSPGGGQISLPQVIYSASKVIFSLVKANQLTSVLSNYQSEMQALLYGKPTSFCSLGFAEISFNKDLTKKYVLSKSLRKCWDEYGSTSNNSNSSELDSRFKEMEVYLESPREFFIENVEDFNLQKDKIKCTSLVVRDSDALRQIKERISVEEEAIRSKAKSLVTSFFESSVISGVAKRELHLVLASTQKRSERWELLQNLVGKFERLEKNIPLFPLSRVDIADQIDQVPKNMTKFLSKKPSKKFFNKIMPYRLDNVTKNLNEKLKEELIIQELYLLIRAEIQKAIIYLKNYDLDSNKDTDKINFILSNLKNVDLVNCTGSAIHMEYYYIETLDRVIDSDTNINKGIITNFLGHTSGEEEEYEQIIEALLEGTAAFDYIEELCSSNFYSLKDNLSEKARNDIEIKLEQARRPLWNKMNDNDIAENYVTINHTQIEIPRIDNEDLALNKNLNCFGKGVCVDLDKDCVVHNDASSLVQSHLVLELGVPAYAVSNLLAYSNKVEEVCKNDSDLSVLFFGYTSIREKVINQEYGIYLTEQSTSEQERQRILKVWVQAWALQLIYKKKDRFTFNVSDSFTQKHDKKYLSGVYDLYQNEQRKNLILLFNIFKDTPALWKNLEEQLFELQRKNSYEFLLKLSEAFAASAAEPMERFRREKKSRAQLSIDEMNFVDIEEASALRACVEDISNSTGISCQFRTETIDNYTYNRLHII